MATYLPKGVIKIYRQEGDNADVVFICPDVLDLTGSEVKFEVWTIPDENLLEPIESELVFSKTNELDGGIDVDEQTIIIELLPEDTTGFAGLHKFECQVSNDATYGIVTIAKGFFQILDEIIK